MRGLRAAATSAAVIILAGAGGASAADLGTDLGTPAPDTAAMNARTPGLTSATAPAACTSVADFFTTACQLAAWGVRFYGGIDVGFGYDTNAARFNKYSPSGIQYVPGKYNNGARWMLSPGALGASSVGLRIREPLGAGWSFIGQVEALFDAYSLQLINGPRSLRDSIHVPLASESSNSDSSLQGSWYNSFGYFGFSNDTWGTLTFMRQGTLMRDVNASYDPIPGSAAFSLIGAQGITNGGGAAEQVRQNTTAKYRLNVGNYRFGVFGQFGGYDLGNSARGVIEGSLGADFNAGPGLLSVDSVAGYTRDAVSEILIGAAVNPLTGLGIATSAPTTLQASISDNTNVLGVAKYTVDKLRLYLGYEWMRFAPPSDIPTSFTDIAGYQIGGVPGTTIATTNYVAKNKILQIVWAGARYSITDSLDVVGAWYHYNQNDYSHGAATAGSGGKTTCAVVSTAVAQCAGTEDVVSALVDWKFAPKWDVYLGTGYAQLNGGFQSGALSRSNWNTTAGLRFRW